MAASDSICISTEPYNITSSILLSNHGNEDESMAYKRPGAEWTDGETKLLLDKYRLYLEKIGPLKRFKTRKSMFEQISEDIRNILGSEKTHLQCENRVKNILRRKRCAIKNSQSGASPLPVPYQEQLQAILRKDNSIDPEILWDAQGVTYRGASATPTPQRVLSPTVTTMQAGNTDTEIVIPDLPVAQELAPSNEERREQESDVDGREAGLERSQRPSTARMRDMKYFFEKMEEIEEKKEQGRLEREERRRRERAQREQRREERHRERLEMMERILAALKDKTE